MDAKRAVHYAGWDLRGKRGAVTARIDAERAGAVEAEMLGLRPRQATIAPRDLPSRAPPSEDDPNVPKVGRWAAVVLEEDYDKARESLGELIARRVDQGVAFDRAGASGSPGLVKVVKPGGTDSDRFLRALNEATAGKPPHYLLLVGGPDRLSFEVQFALDARFNTGRLDAGALTQDFWEAAAAYSKKVVRYEDGKSPTTPRALVYSFSTDEATSESHAALSERLIAHLGTKTKENGTSLPIALFGREATTQGLIQAVRRDRPALVVTVTHGLEGSADLAEWGALTDVSFVDGTGGQAFSAAALRDVDSFAEGAVMVGFACFSAGVPKTSAHRSLVDGDVAEIAGAPFVAALPRALLAHPRGPVAFVGHVDRATSGSFDAEIHDLAFYHFANWHLPGKGTLGQAMSTLREDCATAARRLANLQWRAKQGMQRSPQQIIDAWVRYHDALGYILLGDPVLRGAELG